MPTSAAEREPHGVAVRLDDRALHVRLNDGRELSVPLSWFPRLEGAGKDARERWRWIGEGVGIHWEELDEDVSIRGLLEGRHR